jgi:hypothetical protein
LNCSVDDVVEVDGMHNHENHKSAISLERRKLREAKNLLRS